MKMKDLIKKYFRVSDWSGKPAMNGASEASVNEWGIANNIFNVLKGIGEFRSLICSEKHGLVIK